MRTRAVVIETVAVYPSEPDPKWQGRVAFQVNSRRSESHSTLETIPLTIGFCKLTLHSTMEQSFSTGSQFQELKIKIFSKDKTRDLALFRLHSYPYETLPNFSGVITLYQYGEFLFKEQGARLALFVN